MQGFYYLTRPSSRWAYVGHNQKVWEELQNISSLLFIRFPTFVFLTFLLYKYGSLGVEAVKASGERGLTIKVSSMPKPKKVCFDSCQHPPFDVSPGMRLSL